MCKEEFVKIIKTNKNSNKSRESYIKYHYNEFYLKIINYHAEHYDYDFLFNQKLYNYINNVKIIPKCKICNNNVNWSNSNRKYFIYCSNKCINLDKDIKEKIKNTSLLKYGVTNFSKSNLFKEKEKELILTSNNSSINRMLNRVDNKVTEYIKHDNNKNVYFFCNNCNKEFIINSNLLTSRLANNTTICTNCNKNKSYSNIINIILNNLKAENIIFESNNRKILNGKEIDIYLPDYKLGIEIDGLFWHSELFKDKNYHLNKTEECEKQGIQLLHIFEDEINNKLKIVMSIIKNKIGLVDNKIFARKCQIKEINNNTSKEFLNNNHIQGNVNSKVKIGLFYNNELVGIMTFGKKRIAMGNKIRVDGEYEMLRFCNKLNTSIIGGAGKLLSYFIKNYQPKSILTFADRRYSNGNLYKQLKFCHIKNTKPNYYYVILSNITREHRFKYRKNILVQQGFDSNKTEHQIMLERKIPKIFDSGHMKFEMKF
jgi:very-short-patch-repair endonuclease